MGIRHGYTLDGLFVLFMVFIADSAGGRRYDTVMCRITIYTIGTG